MGNKRLELRDGWAWLVLGKEKSRAREYLIKADKDASYIFAYKDEWQDAFQVRLPLINDIIPAKAYFNRLEKLIKSVEEYNDYEKANAVLYGEMDLVEISEEVYTLRDTLKRIIEKCYDRLKKRSEAVHEALVRANHIEAEYGSEIVWKDMSRREILQELQYGRLAETAETKTLYEMYDDGYRWEA